MGYTSFTKQLVQKCIDEYKPQSVIDLGAQNDFSGPNLPAPYISEWYKSEYGFMKHNPDRPYRSIDLNGENHSYQLDLGKPLPKDFLTGDPSYVHRYSDLVVDAGTSEHIGKDGAFSWEAIYNCWLNKFNLCKEGGIIISENPLSTHWENHGFQWYTEEFYKGLELISGLKILDLGISCAMGNCESGKNVWAIQQKTNERFPTLEEFKTLDLRQS